MVASASGAVPGVSGVPGAEDGGAVCGAEVSRAPSSRATSVRGPPSGSFAPPASSSSTYGRMRSGSKSSAAAAWAVRASRRASEARVPQEQAGVLSASLAVPHSGHACPEEAR